MKLQIDSCFKKILEESKILNYLDVWRCNVTADLLLFANEITKNRTNNITLFINKCILENFNKRRDITLLEKIKKSAFLEYYTNEDFDVKYDTSHGIGFHE